MRRYMQYNHISRICALISVSPEPGRTATVSSAINTLYASFPGESVCISISAVWLLWYEFKSSQIVSYHFRCQQFYFMQLSSFTENQTWSTNTNTFPLGRKYVGLQYQKSFVRRMACMNHLKAMAPTGDSRANLSADLWATQGNKCCE